MNKEQVEAYVSAALKREGREIDLSHITSAEYLQLPNRVASSGLNLSGLTSAKSLVLPTYIGGALRLDGLKSAEDLILPDGLHVCGEISLIGLTSGEHLRIPANIRASCIRLDGLKSASGLVLPEKLNAGLSLKGIASIKSLKLPRFLHGELELDGLKVAKGIELPIRMGGISLNGLKSGEGVKFPRRVNGDVSLDGLRSCAGLQLPEQVTGSVRLNGLRSVVELKLPDFICGSLELDNLKKGSGVVLPKYVLGEISLSGMPQADDIKLPTVFSRINFEDDEIEFPELDDDDRVDADVYLKAVFPNVDFDKLLNELPHFEVEIGLDWALGLSYSIRVEAADDDTGYWDDIWDKEEDHQSPEESASQEAATKLADFCRLAPIFVKAYAWESQSMLGGSSHEIGAIDMTRPFESLMENLRLSDLNEIMRQALDGYEILDAPTADADLEEQENELKKEISFNEEIFDDPESTDDEKLSAGEDIKRAICDLEEVLRARKKLRSDTQRSYFYRGVTEAQREELKKYFMDQPLADLKEERWERASYLVEKLQAETERLNKERYGQFILRQVGFPPTFEIREPLDAKDLELMIADARRVIEIGPCKRGPVVEVGISELKIAAAKRFLAKHDIKEKDA